MKIIILLVAFLFPASNTFADTDSPDSTKTTICSEPRQQFRTMIYMPVCATRETDKKCITTPCDTTETKTYSSPCSACADINVISHTQDAC
ncbi:MAG: hypothetical protein COB30_005200 [Ectothiorhodospiraceae bacterium]|nr:hypothetical protein [Ectothiorhodospiraceae bacterium]